MSTCKLQHWSFMRRTHFGQMSGHMGMGVYPPDGGKETSTRPFAREMSKVTAQVTSYSVYPCKQSCANANGIVFLRLRTIIPYHPREIQTNWNNLLFRKCWNTNCQDWSYALRIYLLGGRGRKDALIFTLTFINEMYKRRRGKHFCPREAEMHNSW